MIPITSLSLSMSYVLLRTLMKSAVFANVGRGSFCHLFTCPILLDENKNSLPKVILTAFSFSFARTIFIE